MFNWLKSQKETWRKAAEQGDAIQQFNFGMTYLDRLNPKESDPIEGMKWLRKAAEQGYAPAQNNIGNFLMRGWYKEIKQNYEEAYFWHSLAAKADYYNSADEAAKHLTPEQIKEIDQRVKEWKPVMTQVSQPEISSAIPEEEMEAAQNAIRRKSAEFDPISKVVDKRLTVSKDTVSQLAKFKKAEKFVDLPGVDNAAEKKRLSEHLDNLVDKLIADVSKNPSKLWVLTQFQVVLEAIWDEDTEAQEHFGVELKKLMDILGMESSDGLIGYYRYGDLVYMMQELKTDKK